MRLLWEMCTRSIPTIATNAFTVGLDLGFIRVVGVVRRSFGQQRAACNPFAGSIRAYRVYGSRIKSQFVAIALIVLSAFKE